MSIKLGTVDLSYGDLSGYVNTTGNQTIAGVKTFSSSPIVPTPTTDMQVATKKYVDDNAGGGGSLVTKIQGTVNQPIPNSTNTNATFGSTIINQTGIVATDSITITETGVYKVWAYLFTGVNEAQVNAFHWSCEFFSIPHRTFNYSQREYYMGNNMDSRLSINYMPNIISLVAGDILQLRVQQYSGTTKNIGTRFLCIEKIS